MPKDLDSDEVDDTQLKTRVERLEAATTELQRRIELLESKKKDKHLHALSEAQIPRSPAGGAGPTGG